MGTEWRLAKVYVDSGSMYTILAPSLAPAGFDWRAGRRQSARSVSGDFIEIFLHDLDVQLGSERFTAPVGFSPDLKIGFDILGRKGFFDRYKVEFDERKGTVSFG